MTLLHNTASGHWLICYSSTPFQLHKPSFFYVLTLHRSLTAVVHGELFLFLSKIDTGTFIIQCRVNPVHDVLWISLPRCYIQSESARFDQTPGKACVALIKKMDYLQISAASSEPSGQSFSPSQRQPLEMHVTWSLHTNCLGLQVFGAGKTRQHMFRTAVRHEKQFVRNAWLSVLTSKPSIV